MDLNIIDKDGNPIDFLTQWDCNQTVIIESDGLSVDDISQIHFCNRNSSAAYCVTAKEDGNNNITAEIPNILLTEGLPIYVYLWASNGTDTVTSGRVKYYTVIPMRQRVKPDGFTYVDNISIVDIRLIDDKIENLIKKCNTEFDKINTELKKLDVLSDTVLTGVCTTSSAMVAKAVTISDWELKNGAMTYIKFTYAVPANQAFTLNINNTGSKNVRLLGYGYIFIFWHILLLFTFIHGGKAHLL